MFHEIGSWGMGFGWIFVILFWVAVIWGVGSFLQSPAKKTGTASKDSTKSAREILDERYARGDIDREEYQAKLNDIEH